MQLVLSNFACIYYKPGRHGIWQSTHPDILYGWTRNQNFVPPPPPNPNPPPPANDSEGPDPVAKLTPPTESLSWWPIVHKVNDLWSSVRKLRGFARCYHKAYSHQHDVVSWNEKIPSDKIFEWETETFIWHKFRLWRRKFLLAIYFSTPELIHSTIQRCRLQYPARSNG